MTVTRQDILDAVVARMKTITTAGGYNLNIGAKVYDWKMSPLLPGDLPAIEVRDSDAPMRVETLDGTFSHNLKITIVIMAAGLTAPATARKGLQDISRALATDFSFGGLVQLFTPESSRIEVQQEETMLAAGEYVCSMMYHAAAGTL